MPLDAGVAQRLSFVRYIYGVAVEQSRQPEPLAATAILTFHDAVELFLQLASEHLNVGKHKIEFMQYWDVIDPELYPNRLSQKESMRRLNGARVSLKHHGTLPSHLAIEQFRASVGNFFQDNARLVFSINFDELSLVDLVTYESARLSLRNAEMQLEANDFEQSMISATIAFAQLTDNVNDQLFARYYRSPFSFGQSMHFEKSFFRQRGQPRDPRQNQFEDKILEAVVAMQDAMTALSFGLDYRRYAQFRLLSPVVDRVPGGPYITQITSRITGGIGWPPSRESCQFAIDFVVEAALRIQEIDIDTLVIPQKPLDERE